MYTHLSSPENINKQEFIEYINDCDEVWFNIIGRINRSILEDRDVVLKLCHKILPTKSKMQGYDLKYISEKLRDDEEIVSLFLKISSDNFEFASERLKSDREFVFKYFKKYPNKRFCDMFKHVGTELQNDKDIVKAAINQNGSYFEELSSELQDDDELFHLAINKNPNLYQYASKRIRSNKNMLLAALEAGMGYGIKKAPKKFQNDKEIILKALNNQPGITRYLPKKIRRNKEFILYELSRENIGFIRNPNNFLIDELKLDKEVVKAFISSTFNSIFYEFFGGEEETRNVDNIRWIIDFLAKEVFENVSAVCTEYCDDEIIKFVKTQLKQTVKKLSKILDVEMELIITVIKNNKKSLVFLPDEYLKHIEISQECIEKLPELRQWINKFFDSSSYLKSFNPNITKKDIKNIGKKLEIKIKNGFSIDELIEFFSDELNFDFKPLVLKQLEDEYSFLMEGETGPFSIERYIELDGAIQVFDCSELRSLTVRFKEYFHNSNVDLNACDCCEKLFIDSSFDIFLREEREMLICEHCCSREEIKKESGETNYEYVASVIRKGCYENLLSDYDNSIEDIIEHLNTLKKIIDYGHSIEFARILTMGGSWHDETDYLLKYQPLVEKSNNQGKINKEDYDFFNTLLNTSNNSGDMPLDVDHCVFQYIRLSY